MPLQAFNQRDEFRENSANGGESFIWLHVIALMAVYSPPFYFQLEPEQQLLLTYRKGLYISCDETFV